MQNNLINNLVYTNTTTTPTPPSIPPLPPPPPPPPVVHYSTKQSCNIDRLDDVELAADSSLHRSFYSVIRWISLQTQR